MGSSTARPPLTRSPGPAGQTAQTASCLLALPPPLLSAAQTQGANGETEGEGGGGLANEHNEEADTDHPDLLHPPADPFPFSIHLWVQISLFPTDRLPPPLPMLTPLSSVLPHSFVSPTAGRAAGVGVAEHAPTGHKPTPIFFSVNRVIPRMDVGVPLPST